jgi:hypothetical protein
VACTGLILLLLRPPRQQQQQMQSCRTMTSFRAGMHQQYTHHLLLPPLPLR